MSVTARRAACSPTGCRWRPMSSMSLSYTLAFRVIRDDHRPETPRAHPTAARDQRPRVHKRARRGLGTQQPLSARVCLGFRVGLASSGVVAGRIADNRTALSWSSHYPSAGSGFGVLQRQHPQRSRRPLGAPQELHSQRLPSQSNRSRSWVIGSVAGLTETLPFMAAGAGAEGCDGTSSAGSSFTDAAMPSSRRVKCVASRMNARTTFCIRTTATVFAMRSPQPMLRTNGLSASTNRSTGGAMSTRTATTIVNPQETAKMSAQTEDGRRALTALGGINICSPDLSAPRSPLQLAQVSLQKRLRSRTKPRTETTGIEPFCCGCSAGPVDAPPSPAGPTATQCRRWSADPSRSYSRL